MLKKLKSLKRWFIVPVLVVAGVGLGACTSGPQHQSATQQEAHAAAAGLNQLLQSQPVPEYKWSQIREDLVQIENAQASTVQTTSFFFNLGVQDPIQSCPSIGFPVPSDAQLTNPLQVAPGSQDTYRGATGVAIGQIDPNGTYTGQSSGTYVICVLPNGTNYINYWEGNVQTVAGPAVWDTATHSVKLTGPSTAQVKTNG